MRCGSVLLADNLSPLRGGIRTLLHERFAVVVMVADVKSLLEMMQKLQPDLVIVDVSLQHIAGKIFIATLQKRFAGINVIALNAFDDRIVVDRSPSNGAVAVVLKSFAIIDLVPDLKTIRCGRQYVSLSAEIVSDLLWQVILKRLCELQYP